uniref:Uncharacterized protein n=1 Tax=Florenciella parvula TaxID=236787 RepID=A0A7S2FZX7_9STRA|mmetsp:Transcript_28477/g.58387  ORF Transcript_28477/g.58387 Transcript_28477/m.58387 type:complete len:199 (+) Transcript_28477:119-715(+)|eukprot:CAMPEP_0182530676 /NCGR_PEP_ID=MMETSP1323-20130603/6292_1 /TAXON_ID=236787 /ORGANISM="Florenciella parvula, Strain RCC1693" /LENGTH=198 /DNA_ID=CAMNT_0024739995 /DNA_START=104 /DNA_END=700 /DNA_ORIENTATION=+
MDGSNSALSAGAISFTPFTAGAQMVPTSDTGGQWMPGTQIPQPHVYEQDGVYAEHDAADAFAQQYHHSQRGHSRRWSQPNPQYAHHFGQHGAVPLRGQMYDINMYSQHQGQMQYHFSPPSSPPTTPDVQVNTPPTMSLSGGSRRHSRSAPPSRRNSSPDLGRRATAPSGQRIYLLPKAVNSDLLHHGVQLDYDEAASC